MVTGGSYSSRMAFGLFDKSRRLFLLDGSHRKFSVSGLLYQWRLQVIMKDSNNLVKNGEKIIVCEIVFIW